MQEAISSIREVKNLLVSDHDRVTQWLKALESALRHEDKAGLEAVFLPESHWRDLLAFTWNVTPTNGTSNIAKLLLDKQKTIQARNFTVSETGLQPRRTKRAGKDIIEAIFEFETAIGRCKGVVRIPANSPDKAWIISTTLRELKGHEEPIGNRRPDGKTARVFGGQPLAKRRAEEVKFENREPAVLIVGGGHNGLMLSARLRMLGVESLIVERLSRVGDVWRRRYSALALHNGIPLNHMPYMPYPSTWPHYLPKDMLGDWIESYATALDCNVWTDTVFVSGEFDDTKGIWNATVRRKDGMERTLHPKHLVFANGIVGEPNIPEIPGLKSFGGQVVHAHDFDSGEPWRGKNVVVMGVGNSAHDIAQDLHGHGANVHMVQRGSITVFSVKSASLNHSIYYNEGLSIEDCDLLGTCNTFPVLLKGYQLATKTMLDLDKELLANLHAKGFKLNLGPDGGGHQMHVRKNHGGYYLNVGCSDLIAKGEIGLIQYEDFECFTDAGLLMKNGTVIPADLVVMATGYHTPGKVIRELLGEEVADKIGAVWGLDEGGELCNMYKPTPQKGLWFTGGGFAQGRVWSHYVAMQIKARDAGIINPAQPSKPVLDTMTRDVHPYTPQPVVHTDQGCGAGTDGL